MDYVMRRRSTVGGALEMFSLPLPLQGKLIMHSFWKCADAVLHKGLVGQLMCKILYSLSNIVTADSLTQWQ